MNEINESGVESQNRSKINLNTQYLTKELV